MATPRPPPPPAGPFLHLPAATLDRLLPPSTLIPHFRTTLPALTPTLHSPPRQVLPIDPAFSSSLLLMPSWSLSPALPYLGVKLLTSYPHLSPSISALYLLFHSPSGRPLASLDGTHLTLLRTSAVSALASSLLSNPNSRTLVMVGAGALAPFLISAHRHVRPGLKRILIWNRTAQRALDLIRRLRDEHSGDVELEHCEDLDGAIGAGDIVCCATGSERALVRGALLKSGAHLDLVGSFRPGMRECDDEAVRRGRVFVDFEAAVEEAGELVGALERGVIRREDVVGTLVELAGGEKVGRRGEEEVTVFKSVGTAVVDILAAQLAYESYLKETIELPHGSA